MRLRFHGAVRTVTGSMHYLHINGDRILLDCGLYQGSRRSARQINETFPFRPADITSVVLSHAHIDHSGNLPNLVKRGFKGSIYATPGTADMCRILLADSAHIHESDAEYLNRKRRRQHGKNYVPIEPLYTKDDVEDTLPLLHEVPYRETVEVARGVRSTFYDAGHILGSAVTVLELEEKGHSVRLAFTGDVGRPQYPILRDPVPIPDPVDYVISESTYGDKEHAPIHDIKPDLGTILTKAVDRGARVVIPAFSVGRTQNLVYYMNQMKENGTLPDVEIFVDSPLAVNATDLYRSHPECYDAETIEFLENGEDPFGFESLTYVRSVEESIELNTKEGPFITIAASGMCEGGRVLHHLKHSIEDPKNLVLIVGFMAPHTLGRRLLEERKEVRIYGETYRRRCQVKTLGGLSAHADRSELGDYLSNLDRDAVKATWLVHGEEEKSFAFADHLTDLGFSNVIVPEVGNRYEL